ncbi:pyridoxal phosphate-dependent decarboxylase family protein [Flavobacterium aquidurense]|uniref:L-2,4-diaminobutyrate decarboxylase n=2 Tax=Flavobacterium TaxID=237 RepID=A0A7W7IW87_9FLAO|nr:MULTISPECIES: aminotransferase class I/II-fold pyridoxal phosphate-dependent enzyme [Flavobacterium]MBB4801731.1 L-2,4-diaminobutyrate decarboxylase [Flavobacterium nitrogenifigens]MBB6386689.1 L-2,4-diaminobutyrate decarboxylase [Flavobacterium notoginsengisoli]
MNEKLKELYNAETFRENGYDLIDLLADFLTDSQRAENKVNNWLPPSEQLEYWENYDTSNSSPKQFFADILEKSINVHHPKYMGHQISPTAPLAALSSLVVSIVNNGAAVYEMGAAGTAIEKVIINKIAKKIGFDENADGFVTSGGSLANLTALLTARKKICVDSPIGNQAVMVSSEAHYSIEKALRIMGLEEENIIKIPINEHFNMKTSALKDSYHEAQANGKKIFAVVGSAPSTSTGSHDNLEEIARFCNEHSIWFHVDAAHGGGAIFSTKYRYLLAGLEKADSVTIDGHKMLMMPSIMSFLFFKNGSDSYAAFKQRAAYLWDKEKNNEWQDLAKRTFECTKNIMSIQFYAILKFYGEGVFDDFVTRLYDVAKMFATDVAVRQDFELLLQPQANIVCFRYLVEGWTDSRLNQLNRAIREYLLKEGDFYIVQTTINDNVYLRITFMNPNTTGIHTAKLLKKIQALSSFLVAYF